MHTEALSFVADARAELDFTPKVVVEIGSRNVNGTIRGLFAGAAFTGVDIEPGEGVDVVASGAVYVHPTPVDVVVCTEVFEHTPDAKEIVARAADMLRPGGVFIATMAATGRFPHSAVDGGELRPDEFYRNVNKYELTDWLDAAGFTEWYIDLHDVAADIRTVAIK